MTAPELKRYAVTTKYSSLCLLYGAMDEEEGGEYVRFADVKAYTQAAIAAAVKPLEWEEGFREFTANALGDTYRIKVAVNGAVSWQSGHMKTWQFSFDVDAAKADAQADYQARILSALSIPTDAMAALEAMLAEAEQRGFDRAINAALAKLDAGVESARQKLIAAADSAEDHAFWSAILRHKRIERDAIRAMKGGE